MTRLMEIPAPFRLGELTVALEWTDYNQHLTESACLLVMGESSDAFFRWFGVDDAYRAAGQSLYTVETHLRNLREAREGDRLDLTIQVLGLDAKRLHIVHEMYRRVSAAEAARWGLVNRVAPGGDLMATALGPARTISASAPLSVAAALEIMRQTEGTSVADGYRIMRGDGLPAYRRMLDSDDAREGVRAFTERRPPRWTGR